MFQTWPVFVSLNPEYIKMFLQPMMSYLERPRSEGWPWPWVIHDMGACMEFLLCCRGAQLTDRLSSISKRNGTQ